MKIHIINGPNLNLLGKREPEIYGGNTFESFLEDLKKKFPNLELSYFQSNHEGKLIDYLQKIGYEADGIVINAAAYSHTSIALADVLKAITAPTIEVHISNVFARETFRYHSHLTANCVGTIIGLGLEGYVLALQYFQNIHSNPMAD